MSRGVDAAIENKVCTTSKGSYIVKKINLHAAFFGSPPGNSIFAKLVTGTSFFASPANNSHNTVICMFDSTIAWWKGRGGLLLCVSV